MSNPYFTKSGYPSSNARAVSATLRAEIAAIEAGFDLLPTLSGNGGKIIRVNSGATALEASNVTLTEPATSATLTIADTKTLTVTESTTLNGGVYTPTFSDLAGGFATVAATDGSGGPAIDWMWGRGAGDLVEVFGSASFAGGSLLNGSFEVTLPVASTIGVGECFGFCAIDDGGASVAIRMGYVTKNTAGDKAKVMIYGGTASPIINTIFVKFSYKVN